MITSAAGHPVAPERKSLNDGERLLDLLLRVEAIASEPSAQETIVTAATTAAAVTSAPSSESLEPPPIDSDSDERVVGTPHR